MELAAQGSITTDATEKTLIDTSEPGSFTLQVNLGNLSGGVTPDIIRLTTYVKTAPGGAYAAAAPPVDLVGGLATGIFMFGPAASNYGYKATIRRLQGTDRSYEFAVINHDPHIYVARVRYNRDATDSTDEYSVTFYRNGAQLAAGAISSPTLTVTKRNGDVLIDAGTLTQVTGQNWFRYDATGGERQSAGEAIAPQVTATIDGAARTCQIDFAVRDR